MDNYLSTRELPGVALVNISTGQIFMGKGINKKKHDDHLQFNTCNSIILFGETIIAMVDATIRARRLYKLVDK